VKFSVDRWSAVLAASTLGRWWLDHPEGAPGRAQRDGLGVYERAVERLTGFHTEPEPTSSTTLLGLGRRCPRDARRPATDQEKEKPMRWSRRRHARQRQQLRRVVAFLHELNDRVPFDPVSYVENKLPIEQVSRLVIDGRISIHRLPPALRRELRAWGEQRGVPVP